MHCCKNWSKWVFEFLVHSLLPLYPVAKIDFCSFTDSEYLLYDWGVIIEIKNVDGTKLRDNCTYWCTEAPAHNQQCDKERRKIKKERRNERKKGRKKERPFSSTSLSSISCKTQTTSFLPLFFVECVNPPACLPMLQFLSLRWLWKVVGTFLNGTPPFWCHQYAPKLLDYY